MTKSVLDLANLRDVLVDPSKATVPKGGYKSAVTGSWDGIRVGVTEPETRLFPHKIVKYEKDVTDQMVRCEAMMLLVMAHRNISYESGVQPTNNSRL